MKKYLLVILSCFFILASCGTTTLMTDYPYAEIYVDGDKKGTGKAEIKRYGAPDSKTVVAKYRGREIGRDKIKRKFGPGSLVLTLYSYGLGFFFTWHYPETIYIQTNKGQGNQQDLNKKEENIWMEPPGAWK